MSANQRPGISDHSEK